MTGLAVAIHAVKYTQHGTIYSADTVFQEGDSKFYIMRHAARSVMAVTSGDRETTRYSSLN